MERFYANRAIEKLQGKTKTKKISNFHIATAFVFIGYTGEHTGSKESSFLESCFQEQLA